MRTSSHSECHQPGQHIFLYVPHDLLDPAITTYHEDSVYSYMQLCSVSIVLDWYGLVMSFPAKAFGLVSLHTS